MPTLEGKHRQEVEEVFCIRGDMKKRICPSYLSMTKVEKVCEHSRLLQSNKICNIGQVNCIYNLELFYVNLYLRR